MLNISLCVTLFLPHCYSFRFALLLIFARYFTLGKREARLYFEHWPFSSMKDEFPWASRAQRTWGLEARRKSAGYWRSKFHFLAPRKGNISSREFSMRQGKKPVLYPVKSESAKGAVNFIGLKVLTYVFPWVKYFLVGGARTSRLSRMRCSF